MATSVVAYKQAFGFDAPPYTYDDFEQSDVIVLVGSNLASRIPSCGSASAATGISREIIVVDPRKTETAMAATLHLPLAPKSDLTLFYGLAQSARRRRLDRSRLHRRTHDGLRRIREHVAAFTPERVAEDDRH